MDYKQLLSRAEDSIDREKKTEERFEIPTAEILNQGNFTIITNFSDIVKTLRREVSHVMKFMLRELAVPGDIKGKRAEFQGRFSSEQINKKLELYAHNYVICPACGKPDTMLINEDGLIKMKCEACTNKHVVKNLK